eukprot:302740_1
MNKNDENNNVRTVDLSTGTKGANRVYNVAAVMAGSVIMTQGQRNDDISQEKASQKMISDTTEGSSVYNVAAVMKGSVIVTRGQKAQSKKHSETYADEGAKREELVTTSGAAENAVTVVDHIEENDMEIDALCIDKSRQLTTKAKLSNGLTISRIFFFYFFISFILCIDKS